MRERERKNERGRERERGIGLLSLQWNGVFIDVDAGQCLKLYLPGMLQIGLLTNFSVLFLWS